jgi:hypothetical protein
LHAMQGKAKPTLANGYCDSKSLLGFIKLISKLVNPFEKSANQPQIF